MVSLCCFCSGMRLTRRAVPSLPRIKFTRMHGFAYDSLLPNGLTSRHIGAHPVGFSATSSDLPLARSVNVSNMREVVFGLVQATKRLWSGRRQKCIMHVTKVRILRTVDV